MKTKTEKKKKKRRANENPSLAPIIFLYLPSNLKRVEMVRNSSFNDRSFQIHPTIFGIRSDKNQEEKGKKKEKRTKGKDRISPWIEEAFAEATARFRSHEIQASAPNGGRISHCTVASKPRFGSCVCRTTEVSGHESIDSSFLA